MTKELTRFTFEETSVRTFGTKLEPWFAAVDVLRALGIHKKNVSRAIETLDDDEKGVVNLTTPGGEQEAWIISEPGFYKIALRARTPKAKEFTRWVTHEVLPSIRKRGYYINPRWGFAPTDDGYWVLATGERLSPQKVRWKAEKLGIAVDSASEIKAIIRKINERESYLAVREKYPYTYDEMERAGKEYVEYYRCFIKDNEDRTIYSKDYGLDEYFSEAFVELIRRVDEEEK